MLSFSPASTGTGSLIEPGLYLWWVHDRGADDLELGLGFPLGAGAIYGRQAGATVGLRRSSATLGSRISGNHLGGIIRGSTFRWTLASILGADLELEPLGGRQMTGDSEATLSTWMREHLSITVPEPVTMMS